ncbi:MAG: hypothetical protein ABSF98_07225 [Bryobacteraceae bacterium]
MAIYLLLGLTNQVILMVIYARVSNADSGLYAKTYWTGDIILHGLILLLVLFLIREALVGSRGPDMTAFAIPAPVAVFVGVTLYLLYTSGPGWVFLLSRNLSFAEELLNLVLWIILIRNRSRDVVLLLVSAGLGIQVTGEVIGRTIWLPAQASSISWLPKAIVLLCQAGALFVWYCAFRAYGRRRAESRPRPAI